MKLQCLVLLSFAGCICAGPVEHNTLWKRAPGGPSEALDINMESDGGLDARDIWPFGNKKAPPANAVSVSFNATDGVYNFTLNEGSFCDSDLLHNVSRPGGGPRQDIKASDYWAAVQKNPQQEMDLVVQDIKWANTLATFWDKITGDPADQAAFPPPAPSKRGLEERAASPPLSDWERHVHVTIYKFIGAYTSNFLANFVAQHQILNQNTTTAAQVASVTAVGVAQIQINNAVIDWYAKKNQIVPIWVVIFRYGFEAAVNLFQLMTVTLDIPAAARIPWDGIRSWLPFNRFAWGVTAASLVSGAGNRGGDGGGGEMGGASGALAHTLAAPQPPPDGDLASNDTAVQESLAAGEVTCPARSKNLQEILTGPGSTSQG